ncbi:MAG: hypothetical protein IT379_28175 [Deltaproteobacteria bacterium]|nr:hypothetical protein [Deltaproteobacteria bacterium]
MSGAARVQALAVSTEFPNPTLRLVSDRVTSPAAQLARQMLSDETTALLSSAPIIGFARDGDHDAMAVFAGVSRRELQLDDAPDVLWLAPDTVALWTGRVESVCRTRGPSALARLREIDPSLDRAATIAGFWRGAVDDAPGSCVEMAGSIHLPPSRYARGHGFWLCGSEADAAAGARFLTSYSAARSSESIPGLVLEVVTGGDELIPRSAHPQGNRVRAEFGSRVAVGPAPQMSPEALRYYRRGEAIPPWEQPDPWGYPQVDGPPPGYDDVDPGPERPPVARPPGWQGPTRSTPNAPPPAPHGLE